MKNNKFPGKIDRHVTPQQRRHRVGALVAGATLLGLGAGFTGGYVVGSDGKVPEAIGTCVGPVTPSEIEGGIGGLQDTLGTEKVKVDSMTGASIESEAAKNLRERERRATLGLEDTFVPVLENGDVYTAEDVAEGTCRVQPGAEFTALTGQGQGSSDT
jgi:hypothetical protein